MLIRYPNWLGDAIMACPAMIWLNNQPEVNSIDLIIKHDIREMVSVLPFVEMIHPFTKKKFGNHRMLRKFGRDISQTRRYDLFICLPESFSSAVMGWGTGISRRIGYNKELRNVFFTKCPPKPKGLHRVEEYLYLVQYALGFKEYSLEGIPDPFENFSNFSLTSESTILYNPNSKAQSRRLPLDKAVEILLELYKIAPVTIIGSSSEKAFTDEIIEKANLKNKITTKVGKTGLPDLAETITAADLLVSVDSGPAHLANLLGTPTVVLFGAGDEFNTGPYFSKGSRVIRSNDFACECKVKNECKYEEAKCLKSISWDQIESGINSLKI